VNVIFLTFTAIFLPEISKFLQNKLTSLENEAYSIYLYRNSK